MTNPLRHQAPSACFRVKPADRKTVSKPPRPALLAPAGPLLLTSAARSPVEFRPGLCVNPSMNRLAGFPFCCWRMIQKLTQKTNFKYKNKKNRHKVTSHLPVTHPGSGLFFLFSPPVQLLFVLSSIRCNSLGSLFASITAPKLKGTSFVISFLV